MSYDVAITRMDTTALFDLKGTREDLAEWIPELNGLFPDAPNTVTRLHDVELYWIGPDHWLLRGPLAMESQLFAMTKPISAPNTISIILISDTLAFFRIIGPDTHHIMAIAGPLDIHPRAFPDNAASYSEVFGLKALIIREQNGFELAVDRSFGDMTQDYLNRAMGI